MKKNKGNETGEATNITSSITKIFIDKLESKFEVLIK